jgi:hypothetical protein
MLYELHVSAGQQQQQQRRGVMVVASGRESLLLLFWWLHERGLREVAMSVVGCMQRLNKRCVTQKVATKVVFGTDSIHSPIKPPCFSWGGSVIEPVCNLLSKLSLLECCMYA